MSVPGCTRAFPLAAGEAASCAGIYAVVAGQVVGVLADHVLMGRERMVRLAQSFAGAFVGLIPVDGSWRSVAPAFASRRVPLERHQ